MTSKNKAKKFYLNFKYKRFYISRFFIFYINGVVKMYDIPSQFTFLCSECVNEV